MKERQKTQTIHNKYKSQSSVTNQQGLIVGTNVPKDIREELKELKLLYKELVEKLIPIEEPTKAEKKAIEEEDETANEKELMTALD